ncbi:hypothetical protein RTCIAT899_PB00555 (plasmid) [Rhizobium tropici CIAT 899]|nr:hypothetical protein RTCIAT899_PB00555 [Rhizobium tropici CIAT 899]
MRNNGFTSSANFYWRDICQRSIRFIPAVERLLTRIPIEREFMMRRRGSILI